MSETSSGSSLALRPCFVWQILLYIVIQTLLIGLMRALYVSNFAVFLLSTSYTHDATRFVHKDKIVGHMPTDTLIIRKNGFFNFHFNFIDCLITY